MDRAAPMFNPEIAHERRPISQPPEYGFVA